MICAITQNKKEKKGSHRMKTVNKFDCVYMLFAKGKDKYCASAPTTIQMKWLDAGVSQQIYCPRNLNTRSVIEKLSKNNCIIFNMWIFVLSAIQFFQKPYHFPNPPKRTQNSDLNSVGRLRLRYFNRLST